MFGNIFPMTPCQNPHFILARFYMKFLSAGNKFDHSRSTNQGVFQTPQANVQSCHSYRNSCPPASALRLQWVDLCLPLEGRGQIPGRAGGKKNFELQLGRRPSAGAVAVRDAPASQPDSTATASERQSRQPVRSGGGLPERGQNALLRCRHPQREPREMVWSARSRLDP